MTDANSVSILVLVDVALEPVRPSCGRLIIWVSILVLVDVALEPETRMPGRRRISNVSILVLVDVALEPCGCQIVASSMRKFQSLFSWMSLLNRVRDRHESDDIGQVSILVLVDVALEPEWFNDFRDCITRFQSLFSWMSLLNCPCSHPYTFP